MEFPSRKIESPGGETEPPSRLARLLRAGHFVVTAELTAPDSPHPEAVHRAARPLLGRADAVNCTDNAAAHVHLSPLAVARLLAELGMDPIVQLTCRDRNRLALQADLLGAAALGVRNVVLMSGDYVTGGDHPEAKAVYDLDSIHLVRTARILRDRGTYLSGRKLEAAPRFFIGAVENPFAPPFDFRPHRLAKKAEAGAEFVQTQIVFNLARFREFMAQVEDLGLLEKVFVIASVCVPRSARAARYMREQVPGMDVPEEVLGRLEAVPRDRQADEGIRIALEVFGALREIPGLSGVHLIAIRWEEGIARLAEEAGLLPRPVAEEMANTGRL